MLDEASPSTHDRRYMKAGPPTDGPSPYHRSTGAGISPYRNEASQSSFHEGKGFLGVPMRESKSWKSDSFDSCERIGENNWEMTPHHGKQLGSISMSPSIDRTLYVDSLTMRKTPNSKSSSVDATADTKGMDSVNKNSAGQRMEESPVLETRGRKALQPKFSVVVEPGLLSCSERSIFEEMDSSSFVKNGSNDGPLALKVEDQEKNDPSLALSFLPPPLPKSPSESWLQRTLPSVSSKNPYPQSLLGIQVQHSKQALWASSYDLKWLTDTKPSKHTLGR